MHRKIRVSIAISLSMIMTFTLHCIMEHIPLKQSYLRLYLLDHIRNFCLSNRCFFIEGMQSKTCDYFVEYNDAFYISVSALLLLLLCFIQYYCSIIRKHIGLIIFTPLVVEFLSQYVSSLNSSSKIDVLTIYLFVWQFTFLAFSWINLHLLPPILIIEHGSFCINTALTAWMANYIFCGYMPLQMKLFYMWFVSIVDIRMCLHYEDDLYDPRSTDDPRLTNGPRSTDEPVYEIQPRRDGFYYTHGVDEYEKGGSLGYGDFFDYNLLVLFVLSPSSSLMTKIYVTFGTILSVQLGSLLTHLLRRLAKKYSAPGIPLPVVTVSTYLFILGFIMPNEYNLC